MVERHRKKAQRLDGIDSYIGAQPDMRRPLGLGGAARHVPLRKRAAFS